MPVSRAADASLPPDDEGGPGRERALCELLNLPSERLCTTGEVLREMERLGFIDRRGAPPGFLVVLPNGVAFEHAVEAINDAHVSALNAARIELPLVFDGSASDVRELTGPYERQGRVFHLANGGSELRLAYAADAALFSWLRGRDLELNRLPYAIYSPAPAFRLWRSGELGIRLRQYTLPDLHVICTHDDARSAFLLLVAEAARVARHLFGESFAQFIEFTDDFEQLEPDLAPEMAAIGHQFTVARTLPRRTKYFVVKAGLNIDFGAGSLMLFNLQWDNENGRRFAFTAGGQAVTVLHGTVSGALTKLLPAVIGRGLAGLGPRVIPAELAPIQLTILPLRPEHGSVAEGVAAQLSLQGMRANVGPHSGTLASRVRACREQWIPFHAVIGDAEAAGSPVIVRTPAAPGDFSIEEAMALSATRGVHPAGIRWRTRLDSPFSASECG